MNTFILLALPLFTLFVSPFLLDCLHPYILLSIGLLYTCMMIEDFIYQIVDMRVWLVLFLCMQAYTSFSVHFYVDFIIGTILFFVLFSASWKVSPETQKDNILDDDKANSFVCKIPIVGFLPSLGISIIIGNFLPLPVFTFDSFDLYRFLIHQPYCVVGCSSLMLFACYRQRKLYRIESTKKPEPVQYGMGGGDVWVCGAWFAFLGMPRFLTTFFIALWIQLLIISSNYFFKRIGWSNENK